jgi:hypothetical protein
MPLRVIFDRRLADPAPTDGRSPLVAIKIWQRREGPIAVYCLVRPVDDPVSGASNESRQD